MKKGRVFYGRALAAHSNGDSDIVYGLVDPRDNRVFYIGITNDLYLRFKQHILMTGDNKPKQDRIQAILDAKMLPWMVTLEVVDLEVSSAREREIVWIDAYLQDGYKLLNAELQEAVLAQEGA